MTAQRPKLQAYIQLLEIKQDLLLMRSAASEFRLSSPNLVDAAISRSNKLFLVLDDLLHSALDICMAERSTSMSQVIDGIRSQDGSGTSSGPGRSENLDLFGEDVGEIPTTPGILKLDDETLGKLLRNFARIYRPDDA